MNVVASNQKISGQTIVYTLILSPTLISQGRGWPFRNYSWGQWGRNSN